MIMDIGLKKKDRELVAEALFRVLSDTFILYLKTHNYHWNVMGSDFISLHNLFETVYQDLAQAGDEIAERIRALGIFTPGSYAEYHRLTAIKEEQSTPDSMDMVRQLSMDNELMIRRCKEVFDISKTVSDIVTSDLMVRRMEIHGKQAWMLRSHLE